MKYYSIETATWIPPSMQDDIAGGVCKKDPLTDAQHNISEKEPKDQWQDPQLGRRSICNTAPLTTGLPGWGVLVCEVLLYPLCSFMLLAFILGLPCSETIMLRLLGGFCLFCVRYQRSKLEDPAALHASCIPNLHSSHRNPFRGASEGSMVMPMCLVLVVGLSQVHSTR